MPLRHRSVCSCGKSQLQHSRGKNWKRNLLFRLYTYILSRLYTYRRYSVNLSKIKSSASGLHLKNQVFWLAPRFCYGKILLVFILINMSFNNGKYYWFKNVLPIRKCKILSKNSSRPTWYRVITPVTYLQTISRF